jgi:hypothetical protein
MKKDWMMHQDQGIETASVTHNDQVQTSNTINLNASPDPAFNVRVKRDTDKKSTSLSQQAGSETKV